MLSRAGHLQRLVAVSTLADNPHLSHVAPVPAVVKGRCGGELESLLALRPDVVVLTSYNRPEIAQRLAQAGVRTAVLGAFDRLDDVEAHVTELGRLARVEGTAAALATELQTRRAAVARSPVRFASGRAPVLLHVFPDDAVSGTGTLFDDLARAVGAANAAAPLGVKGWPHLGAETLATLKVDFVVVGGDERERSDILAHLRSEPGLKELAAVRAGRLLLVPDKDLGAASEYLVDGLEKLHAALAAAVKAGASQP